MAEMPANSEMLRKHVEALSDNELRSEIIDMGKRYLRDSEAVLIECPIDEADQLPKTILVADAANGIGASIHKARIETETLEIDDVIIAPDETLGSTEIIGIEELAGENISAEEEERRFKARQEMGMADVEIARSELVSIYLGLATGKVTERYEG